MIILAYQKIFIELFLCKLARLNQPQVPVLFLSMIKLSFPAISQPSKNKIGYDLNICWRGIGLGFW
jgi:hypothetical protein